MSTPFLIQPFDIVTTPYRDFNGCIKTNPDLTVQYGLFMVLSVYKDNTVVACKITSNPRYADSFSVFLPKDLHPNLKTDSYLQISKPQCFFLSNLRYLCSVHASIRREVSEKLHVISSSWYSNLLSLTPLYHSPNKKGE